MNVGGAAMTTTDDTREMLKAELEEQAEWRRRKAVEYPDDRRNLDSAEEYERLAKTVKDIPEALLDAYSEAFEAVEDAPDSERWQEMLKDIFRGFSDFANATEMVRAFVDAKREEAEDEDSESTTDAESYLVRSLRVMLDAHGVPSDVAEKVIGLIEEWEKTPAKS
jgi:hypothetical protein